MDIHKFSIAEMYNNSKGKTSLALVSSTVLILTGCIIAIRGAFTEHSETLIHALGFATLGASLLGIRRFTKDKELNPEDHAQ